MRRGSWRPAGMSGAGQDRSPGRAGGRPHRRPSQWRGRRRARPAGVSRSRWRTRPVRPGRTGCRRWPWRRARLPPGPLVAFLSIDSILETLMTSTSRAREQAASAAPRRRPPWPARSAGRPTASSSTAHRRPAAAARRSRCSCHSRRPGRQAGPPTGWHTLHPRRHVRSVGRPPAGVFPRMGFDPHPADTPSPDAHQPGPCHRIPA